MSYTGTIKLLIILGVYCASPPMVAIVNQPRSSAEAYKIQRAYEARVEQRDDRPSIAPMPGSDRNQQPVNVQNLKMPERLSNVDDNRALLTAERDIRMNNPWYRALKVGGISLLVLIVFFVIMRQLWSKMAAAQRKRMLEQLQQGQRLAKELKERR